MRIVRVGQRTAFLLVVSTLVVTITTASLISEPGRVDTGMQLILSPHPDDELLAWPALEDDPSTYTVVVTLTRGEGTNRCNNPNRHTQQQAGEILPDPLPIADDTTSCGDARLASWERFLRQASGFTTEVRLGAATRFVVNDERWGGDADFVVGANAAHVALSMPDGGLNQTGVVSAVEALLEQRNELLPPVPLRRIVAASYWNDSDQRGDNTAPSGGCSTPADCPGTPTAFEYEHPDHRSLTLAMPSLAPLAEAGAWVNVAPGDIAPLRDVLGTGDTGRIETMTLSPDDYEALMGLGVVGEEGPERIGLQQQYYGWLAFPGDWWPAGEVANTEVLFARQQTYLVLPGGGS
jgi:hypothetical protein